MEDVDTDNRRKNVSIRVGKLLVCEGINKSSILLEVFDRETGFDDVRTGYKKKYWCTSSVKTTRRNWTLERDQIAVFSSGTQLYKLRLDYIQRVYQLELWTIDPTT